MNIPIHGASGCNRSCRIDFRDEATEEQKELAYKLRESFDWEKFKYLDYGEFLKLVQENDQIPIEIWPVLNTLDVLTFQKNWKRIEQSTLLTSQQKSILKQLADDCGLFFLD